MAQIKTQNKKLPSKSSNHAIIGFEAELFKAADLLRANMEPSDYKQFVQSEKFVKEHGGRINSISIYGQESNNTTWRLAKMNLAIRGIDADIKFNNDGSFHKDEHKTLKADFILANPQFNTSDWGGDRLNFVLTPGRYVGSMAKEEDNEPFAEKMTRLVATLKDQTNEANRLNSAIVANLKELGFEL